MIQGIRKKISYIQLTIKPWLSFIIVSLILSCLIYVLFFNINIESQNVLLSILGRIYANSFNDLDSDNVVSILGTLAQSNATILAIVISLSFVVIEFSASKYSARVVDVFKKDPVLWGFIIVYGLSIFYPVYLITLNTHYINYSTLKLHFTKAYALSIIAYFSLSYYILYVFKMMKPSSVIDALSKKIGIKSLSGSSEEIDKRASKISKEEPKINRITIKIKEKKDPVLPIIDIIRASIERYDYTTARDGLGTVSNCLLNVLRQNPLEEKRISEHVFQRIHEIWKLALKTKDSEFIYMILAQYCSIGKLCTYPIEMSHSSRINSLGKPRTKALIPLFNVLNIQNSEEEITQTNLLYTTFLSEYYLKEAFKSIVKVNDEEFQNLSTFFALEINKIGSDTFKNRYELEIDKSVKHVESLERSTSEFSYILKDIGIAAINAGSKSAFKVVIDTFNYIGEAAIYHNLIHSIAHILENLKIIGEESAKKGGEFEPLTKQIVKCLENLASKIDNNSQKLSGNTQNQLVEYYEYIKLNYHTYETTKNALEALKNREKREISDIYAYISMIARESIKTNLLDVTRQCLKSLEHVERILRDDTESRRICEMIRDIGLEAVKKEQTFPLMKDIIKSLYSISLLQFGYMFDWDRDPDKQQTFLKKEYSGYLARGLQSSYSNFVDSADFKDMGDSNYTVYPDDMIYGEKTLIIGDEERKDIKGLYLKDIDDGYRTTKLFKFSKFKDSGKAYYRIPELLKEHTDPILEHVLNSPSDDTLKPFTMIINCFENFGITSIHFRDEFSLNRIFIHSLVEIEDSFFDYKYSKYNEVEYKEDNNAWEYLDLMTQAVSNSIYKLAVESLTYNFVDFSRLHQQMEYLIYIQRKYHNIFWAVAKFERILKMIQEYELKESESEKFESEREKIITITENAIEEFKNQN